MTALLKVLFAILAFGPLAAQAQERTAEQACPHAERWKPTAEQLAEFKTAEPLKRANFCNADLRGAQLNNADLTGAQLNNANLIRAQLDKANLALAELDKATLFRAQLNNADLTSAQLNNADLRGAQLNNADLTSAQLNSANLFGARLNNAILSGAQLKDAQLAHVVLKDATYAPASAPPAVYVAGIMGLETVRFPAGQEIGLVQLRDLLQKAGLRESEREATYAIEKGRTEYGNVVEGVFRTVAFDWTTAYGLHPARASGILIAIWALLIPIYWWPIWSRSPRRGRIFRIWPPGRVEPEESSSVVWLQDRPVAQASGPTWQKDAKVERLHSGGLLAVVWAAWFSLLSAFHIGFREFSVGTWLSRVHPRQFALEATGWVRTVSGLQSLLSVYLLAMWVLTYFGRPFQ